MSHVKSDFDNERGDGTRKEEIELLIHAHNTELQEIQASIMIKIAGPPAIVTLLLLIYYLHILELTLFGVGSLLLVIPSITVCVFAFGKFTRDHIGECIMTNVYGFDAISTKVVKQFCSPSVAINQLANLVHRQIRSNTLDIYNSDMSAKQQLMELRRRATESFLEIINNKINNRLVEHQFTLGAPSIFVTARLTSKV